MQFRDALAWDVDEAEPDPGQKVALRRYLPVDLLLVRELAATRAAAVDALRTCDRLCTLLDNQPHVVKNDKLLIVALVERTRTRASCRARAARGRARGGRGPDGGADGGAAAAAARSRTAGRAARRAARRDAARARRAPREGARRAGALAARSRARARARAGADEAEAAAASEEARRAAEAEAEAAAAAAAAAATAAARPPARGADDETDWSVGAAARARHDACMWDDPHVRAHQVRVTHRNARAAPTRSLRRQRVFALS